MKFLTNITPKNEIEHTPYIRNGLSKFKKGEKVTVEVKKLFNKRSLDQNSLLWLWYDIIADYTGYSSEEVHQIAKGLYAPRKQIKLDKFKNKSYSVPKSSTEFSIGEMAEYLLRIQAMAADLGCVLPSPEQYQQGLDSAKMLSE